VDSVVLFEKSDKDITNLSNIELEKHYLFYGYNNNRIYIYKNN
jgi:hypothetical protein